jgi:hypothetical protein
VKNKLYVAGIVIPSVTQLNNYLGAYKKKIFGGSQFNYGDLATWAEKNNTIPQDDPKYQHVPFVIKSHIDVDPKVPVNSKLRISMSTRFLILNAMRIKHAMTDATYKLVYKGIF